MLYFNKRNDKFIHEKANFAEAEGAKPCILMIGMAGCRIKDIAGGRALPEAPPIRIPKPTWAGQNDRGSDRLLPRRMPG